MALIDNEHSRDRGYDVPAIGDDALLKQLEVAEERLQVRTASAAPYCQPHTHIFIYLESTQDLLCLDPLRELLSFDNFL